MNTGEKILFITRESITMFYIRMFFLFIMVGALVSIGLILITAVQKFRARAIGIEIDPKIAKEASDTILKLGLQNKARVVRADVFDVDLSQADVVTLYLTTSFNEKLRPKFEKTLRPGTRVVSHDYGIRGWNPKEVEEVFVHGRRHRIFLYIVEGSKN